MSILENKNTKKPSTDWLDDELLPWDWSKPFYMEMNGKWYVLTPDGWQEIDGLPGETDE